MDGKLSTRRVLVSGASGTIGVEVAAELARAGDHVLGMIHRNPELVRNNGRRIDVDRTGIDTVRADVTDPHLGLSKGDYDRLRSSVDLIVHLAAVTDFGRASEVYEEVNEQGTRNMLALAERGKKSAIPFLHVSTAYVCGDQHGVVRENEPAGRQGHATNRYEESRRTAEVLVREAEARGVPTAIARPSVVVGSGRTGTTREFKNLYVLIKVVLEGRIGVVPGNYDATVDIVPIDYVVAMLVDIAHRIDQATGKTFHLVGDAPVTLRDCSDVVAEYPSFHVPRVVPPQSFDPSNLTSIERKYYERVVSPFTPYLTRRIFFSAEESRGFLPAYHQPQPKVLLRRLLDYCIRRRYLGTPQTPITSVLDRLAGIA